MLLCLNGSISPALSCREHHLPCTCPQYPRRKPKTCEHCSAAECLHTVCHQKSAHQTRAAPTSLRGCRATLVILEPRHNSRDVLSVVHMKSKLTSVIAVPLDVSHMIATAGRELNHRMPLSHKHSDQYKLDKLPSRGRYRKDRQVSDMTARSYVRLKRRSDPGRSKPIEAAAEG